MVEPRGVEAPHCPCADEEDVDGTAGRTLISHSTHTSSKIT